MRPKSARFYVTPTIKPLDPQIVSVKELLSTTVQQPFYKEDFIAAFMTLFFLAWLARKIINVHSYRLTKMGILASNTGLKPKFIVKRYTSVPTKTIINTLTKCKQPILLHLALNGKSMFTIWELQFICTLGPMVYEFVFGDLMGFYLINCLWILLFTQPKYVFSSHFNVVRPSVQIFKACL